MNKSVGLTIIGLNLLLASWLYNKFLLKDSESYLSTKFQNPPATAFGYNISPLLPYSPTNPPYPCPSPNTINLSQNPDISQDSRIKNVSFVIRSPNQNFAEATINSPEEKITIKTNQVLPPPNENRSDEKITYPSSYPNQTLPLPNENRPDEKITYPSSYPNQIRPEEKKETPSFCLNPKFEIKPDRKILMKDESLLLEINLSSNTPKGCIAKIQLISPNFEVEPSQKEIQLLIANKSCNLFWGLAPKKEGLQIIAVQVNNEMKKTEISVRSSLGLSPQVTPWINYLGTFLGGSFTLSGLYTFWMQRQADKKKEEPKEKDKVKVEDIKNNT